MGRVWRALIRHEWTERTRDRWVLVSTGLFALLSLGIVLYGRSAGDAGAVVTAPSLVTLTTLLVPLVALILGHDAIAGERERNTLGLLLSLPVSRAEVLVAKFVGRALALIAALVVGMALPALLVGTGQRAALLGLLPAALLLGVSFLSIGLLLGVLARRVATAASLCVATWFLLVLFYDLGLLAGMVASDGAIPQGLVAALVVANPAGLYRTGELSRLVGESGLADLGLTAALPGAAARGALWATFILGPLGLGGWRMGRDNGGR